MSSYSRNSGHANITDDVKTSGRGSRVFTEAESDQNHCQIGNMGLALKVILGWLDESGGRTA